jgi:hypothetical protein
MIYRAFFFTRQKSYLPSAKLKTLGRKKMLDRVQKNTLKKSVFFTLTKSVFLHSAKKVFAECFLFLHSAKINFKEAANTRTAMR